AESVVLTIRDDVAQITLGSPEEKLIALTLRRMESLDQALDVVEDHVAAGRIRGLVIRGPSPRMFCAGADLKLLNLIQEGNISRLKEILSRSQRLTSADRQRIETLGPESLSEL